MLYDEGEFSTTRRTLTASAVLLRRLHLDGPLLAALAAVAAFGLFVLYSATGENFAQWLRQVEYLVLALVALIALAQVPPAWEKVLTTFRIALQVEANPQHHQEVDGDDGHVDRVQENKSRAAL